MNRIVITRPEFFSGEAAAIVGMLDAGAVRVHLRKPGCSEKALRKLIEDIPACYRLRLSTHDYLHLAVEYGLGGVHLNSRNPEIPEGFSGIVSRSCHTFAELEKYRDLDYLFLSPVYDCISKAGYRSNFSIDELRKAAKAGIIDSHVYALGGVRPCMSDELHKTGFGGMALLGAAWRPVDPKNFRLQYIAPDASKVEAVLRGGCRWVQLRMKDARTPEILAEAAKIAPLCRSYGATFLLDDRVDLVEAAGADGVHLGANDMPVEQARGLLGPGYIIGATANTFEVLARAAAAGADYAGVGPLRFTTTKKNLSPILGLEGYRSIMSRCREAGIAIPVTAIGGIVPDDLAPLAATGVHGVAVSGAIDAVLAAGVDNFK